MKGKNVQMLLGRSFIEKLNKAEMYCNCCRLSFYRTTSQRRDGTLINYARKIFAMMFLVIVGLSVLMSCQQETEILANTNVQKENKQKTIYTRDSSEVKECIMEFLSDNSLTRSTKKQSRKIEKVIDLAKEPRSISSNIVDEFADNFYVVSFSNANGYAIVSKDKRSFPIYAVLDSGKFDKYALQEKEMKPYIQNMIAGNSKEIQDYQKKIQQYNMAYQTRGNTGSSSLNKENAEQDMLKDGWKKERFTDVRLKTTWGQHIQRKNFYLNSLGVLYADAYSDENKKYHQLGSTIATAENAEVFGCTPVAFGQVMYALRDFSGFNTLKYSSGERILWDKMNAVSSLAIENQRFLGWFTANCNPTYLKKGTLVMNINATKFLRKIVGDHIDSRYDNCIVGNGDFDGYGWSEDKRVAEDFFNHPHAFIIMTASSGSLNYVSYHTFVIDGMIEFKKRIKGSGFLGTGMFRKWRDGIRHLYHVNAGWKGSSNGYYLYVQNVNDEFEYTGSNDAMDYRSKTAYLILWSKQDK